MKTFESSIKKKFTFSSCDICDAKCCDGARGSIYSAINLEDFESIANYFPIVFTIGSLGYIMPVVLLSNGKEFCRYIKNSKCVIYDNRPAVCISYPLSPVITNEVFIDTSCPAVNKDGNVILENGEVKNNFYHTKFDDFQEKTIECYFHFSDFNKMKNYEECFCVNEIKFYKFKNDFNDKYLKLHIKSLKHFDEYFTNSF